MPGGRPPKPTELKRRLGNPGKRALPAPKSGEMTAAAAAQPPRPSGLKRHGKRAWDAYWQLGEAWLNPTTDVQILTRLCQAYDEREQLRAEVKRYGHLVAQVVEEDEVDDGPEKRVRRLYTLKINPAVAALRKLEELITRWEGLCGFTPSDRSRLGLAQMKARSALDEFLAASQGGGELVGE